MASGGPDEAARHFTTALEIYERAAPQLDEPPDEAELVASTVDALLASGRPETALSLVDSHLARLPGDAPDKARARLLLARVEALRSSETEAKPSLISGEALRLAGPDRTQLRARILALHAQTLIWDDLFDDSRRAAEEAMELAEELGLPRLLADVGLTLTWLSQHLDRGEGTRTELRRIIEDARTRGDSLSELRGHLRTGGVEYEYGNLEAAERAFLTAADLARAIGRPWTTQSVAARTQAGIMAFMRGAWDHALAIVDTSGEDPPPIARACMVSVELLVAAGRGDTDALSRVPVIRERWHRDGMIAVVGGGAAIELYAERDGAAAALAAYDDVRRVLTPLWGEQFDAVLRLATLCVGVLADEATSTATAAREDVRARADLLVEQGLQVPGWRVEEDRPFGLEGRAWHARLGAERLRLEWLLGGAVDHDELVDRWRSATELFGELGHAFEEARSRARLAAVLRAAGHPEEARAEARIAREAATGLGATPLLREIGGLTTSAPEGLLTPREREILALVAAGRSNGEIGTQLFISAKTVSVHVSNVMAKLGAGSRTEAVALARRDGLLSG